MTIQLIPYAQYGSRLSFYGNIQYGAAPRFLQNYGGWPEQHPNIQDSPVYEQEESLDEIKTEIIQPLYDETIAENVAIIKRLRAELAVNEDTFERQKLREQIDKARKAKVNAFMAAARDDEEATFILFN